MKFLYRGASLSFFRVVAHVVLDAVPNVVPRRGIRAHRSPHRQAHSDAVARKLTSSLKCLSLSLSVGAHTRSNLENGREPLAGRCFVCAMSSS